MELYQNIKNRRLELNLSQAELANKVGYKDKGSISRIENGSLDLTQSQIVKFAKALECSPSYLMGWDKSLDNQNVNKKDIIVELANIVDELKEMNLNPITDTENEIVTKIRMLDERGKAHILHVIDEELKYQRMSLYKEGIVNGKK